MSKYLFKGSEWTPELIDKIWEVIDRYGREKYTLDYYTPQFEITTAEQMIDAYTSHGMPIFYRHWSFGKHYIATDRAYKQGKMGLAYEMVINSNPCIAYLMEDNTATMQTLVMAHANCGHADFFKRNYLFKQHTNPHNILDILENAKIFIQECEDKHGRYIVERFIDHCHTLQYYAIDKFPKTYRSQKEKLEQKKAEIEYERESYNDIWNTLPQYNCNLSIDDLIGYTSESENAIEFDEENIVDVIRRYSLKLTSWQREILKIICTTSQYFYPQMQTQIMNEGWACFWHYTIMTDLHNDGYITEGSYLEFLESHTAVCYQRDNSAINPYALGFAMFMDLKRACLDPDEEDYRWLPDIAGKKDWLTELKKIVTYFKDESFVLQYLSPKIIRKFGLFAFQNDTDKNHYLITGIQTDEDITKIRKTLSEQKEIDNLLPSLKVKTVFRLENVLNIEATLYKDRALSEKSQYDLLKALFELWGGKILLEVKGDSILLSKEDWYSTLRDWFDDND